MVWAVCVGWCAWGVAAIDKAVPVAVMWCGVVCAGDGHIFPHLVDLG